MTELLVLASLATSVKAEVASVPLGSFLSSFCSPRKAKARRVVTAESPMMTNKIDLERVVLRLSDKERDMLKILTAALKVSEYTDEVDAVRVYQRTEKIRHATCELFNLVIGLSLVASELPPEVREQLGTTAPIRYKHFEPVLSSAFEIGRRFKRFNPDRIRSEYGKLLMMLQDAVIDKRDVAMPTLVKPVLSVGDALKEVGSQDLLKHSDVAIATEPLPARAAPEQIARKDAALKGLVAQYGGGDTAKAELIERCLRSIDDAKGFVANNVAPIRQLIAWLDDWFRSETADWSLRIRSRLNGSMLTHSHAEQLHYVKEALTLWSIVQRDIFDFWECVEDDMIGTAASVYRICDTGQGFHRVVQCPLTYRRMHEAISEARQVMGGWVGSTIVHLGDRDVPNALVFIDKYTIIPRLTSPIVATIFALQRAFDASQPEPYPGYRTLLLAGYANPEHLMKTILADFFKHGFDGSGDDGGSCIDGRLTSAWNWCNLLHKKPYYHAFVLTGFTGFDANY